MIVFVYLDITWISRAEGEKDLKKRKIKIVEKIKSLERSSFREIVSK